MPAFNQVIEDKLQIAQELEDDMIRTLANYQCEWKATLNDPEKLKRFRPFINSAEKDSGIVMVEERGQLRPATQAEKGDLIPLAKVG